MKDGNSELRGQLAARLKEEIQRLGLSAEAIAKPCGVDKSTVYNYMAGTRVPDALFLANAREHLGVDAQYLLTGRRERDAVPLPAKDRASLDRLAELPPAIRRTIDDVLLLAWLAADSRRQYEPAPAPTDAARAYDVAPPAAPMQLHEPGPRRRTAAKKSG